LAHHDRAKNRKKSLQDSFWAIEIRGLADLSISVKQEIGILIYKI
jgi:hypothetical protein